MRKYPATRFSVRQPAPEYRTQTDWRTLGLCAVAIAVVVVAAILDGILSA